MSVQAKAIARQIGGRLDVLPRPVRLVLTFARDVVVGVLHDFFWKKLVAGAIRLRGLPPSMGAAVVIAGGLLFVTMVSVALGDLFRTGQELLVISGGAPGRGTLVPATLVPATFVLVAVGASLLLAGALHAAVPVRLAVLGTWCVIGATILSLARALEPTAGLRATPGWLLLAGVPALFAVRWRAAPHPGPELAVLLGLVGGSLAVGAAILLRSDAMTGNSFAVSQLTMLLVQLAALSAPMLFVAGLGVVSFGAEASTWVLRFVNRSFAGWTVFLGLAALGSWRARDLVMRVGADVRATGVVAAGRQLLGAGLLVLALWAYWWALGRFAERRAGFVAGEDKVEHTSARLRLPLGMAFAGLGLVVVPLSLLAQTLSFLGVTGHGVIDGIGAVTRWLAGDAVVAYRLLLAASLIGVGVVLARRGGRMPTAVFLGAVGVTDLVAHALVRLPGLAGLAPSGPGPVDTAWTAVVLVVGLWWLGHGRLSRARAERLLLLVLLGALLSQYSFAASPFRPFLGFAGLGFVVFGLVWGFLTGGSWTNGSSGAFPRSARVYLYLGYSLFSVTLVHFFAAAHDLEQLSRIREFGSNGVTMLGHPLLYALFMLVLAGAIADRPLDATGGAERERAEGPNPREPATPGASGANHDRGP